jgi:hypothetical protein
MARYAMTVADYNRLQADNAQAKLVADIKGRKQVTDDDLLNSQLRDRPRRKKRKPLPTILGDAMAQTASTVQTLLGA